MLHSTPAQILLMADEIDDQELLLVAILRQLFQNVVEWFNEDCV